MSDNWELNELLIQNVSKCPLIHTIKSKSFKNNNKKRKAWEDITQSIYANLGIDMTGMYFLNMLIIKIMFFKNTLTGFALNN